MGGLALVGLVLGAGYFVSIPATYKATTSVLLVDNPTANPVTAVATDASLVSSLPVATAVVKKLGLRQTPSGFLASYNVTPITSQVLVITASGPSSAAAVQRAAAVAAQFLTFRAEYEESSQAQTNASLVQQVTQAQQALDSINAQIQQASGDHSKLAALRAQQTQAVSALSSVQTYAATTKASTQTVTQQMVRGSRVLNAALPAKSSRLKTMVLYAVGGLVGGLALALAIIVIAAITSERLRRRDDIAYAFGAPVGLSVGPLHQGRMPSFPRRTAGRQRDLERIVEHLRKAVPAGASRPAGLAVVAIDDAPTVARAVVALVESIAQRGRVVLADLSDGMQAARLIGVTKPGVTSVEVGGSRVVVVVPASSDSAPVGPLRSAGQVNGHAQPDRDVATACAQADLLLSLVTLDPAVGGDHVGTWATDAVSVVTAGRSTATKIHSAGEMLKLGGARLESVVVVDADSNDESLGMVSAAL
jgi:capsular polysaccharide biosynthesis protein